MYHPHLRIPGPVLASTQALTVHHELERTCIPDVASASHHCSSEQPCTCYRSTDQSGQHYTQLSVLKLWGIILQVDWIWHSVAHCLNLAEVETQQKNRLVVLVSALEIYFCWVICVES